MPAIIAGALLSFTLSLDEFIVTYFTCSADSMTLPVEIYGTVKSGLKPTLNAVSTIFIVVTAITVFGADALQKRRGDQAGKAMTMRESVCLLMLALLIIPCGCHRKRREEAPSFRLVGVRAAGSDRRVHEGDRNCRGLRDV